MYSERLVTRKEDITEAIEANTKEYVTVQAENAQGRYGYVGRFTNGERASAKARELVELGHTVFVTFKTVATITLRKGTPPDTMQEAVNRSSRYE